MMDEESIYIRLTVSPPRTAFPARAGQVSEFNLHSSKQMAWRYAHVRVPSPRSISAVTSQVKSSIFGFA